MSGRHSLVLFPVFGLPAPCDQKMRFRPLRVQNHIGVACGAGREFLKGVSPGPDHRTRTVHTGMAARWGAPVVHAHAARGCWGGPSLGPVAPPRCLGRPYGCPNEPRWRARASLAGNARAMVRLGFHRGPLSPSFPPHLSLPHLSIPTFPSAPLPPPRLRAAARAEL